ncbi:MAG: ABC transporter ATP-binding protein [Candidatus Hodarchaeaceae archaeon]|nr:ABC transporter ATP-binding protein [Candidatus Hodarchaeaceae archaeon]
MAILTIKDLTVKIAGKRVLNGVNLEVPEGETHVLLGPNGSGKTSLIMSILGFPSCRIISGKIKFNGTDITTMPIDKRTKLGIGVAFQNPPPIRGVKMGDVLRHLAKGEVDEIKLAGTTNIPVDFFNRDLNLGFSGGELKRSEVLQVLAQRPSFAIFDEPDSGVDVENLEVIGKAINEFLKGRSGLLITHLGHILRYVKADVAHVMFYGTVACSGEPTRILNQIMKQGYKWCERCPKVRRLR